MLSDLSPNKKTAFSKAGISQSNRPLGESLLPDGKSAKSICFAKYNAKYDAKYDADFARLCPHQGCGLAVRFKPRGRKRKRACTPQFAQKKNTRVSLKKWRPLGAPSYRREGVHFGVPFFYYNFSNLPLSSWHFG